MIDRNQIIKLLQSYLPSADTETLGRLADDVIRDIIPGIYASVRRAANAEKGKTIMQNKTAWSP